MYPGVELLSQMVVLFLVFFWETSVLFSVVPVPIHIPTNSVPSSLFPYPRQHLFVLFCYLFVPFVILLLFICSSLYSESPLCVRHIRVWEKQSEFKKLNKMLCCMEMSLIGLRSGIKQIIRSVADIYEVPTVVPGTISDKGTAVMNKIDFVSVLMEFTLWCREKKYM